MRKTQKIYYSDQYVKKIQAKIVKVNQDSRTIELDRTIAYPEGGGQESDQAVIQHKKTGNTYKIGHVKKIYTQNVKIKEGHYVSVDGIVLHCLCPEEERSLDELNEEDEVTIEIDTLLREKLTTSHSASHFLYLAVQKIRAEVLSGTIGCHIKEGQARFDFRVEERFSEHDIRQIEEGANEFIQQDAKIKTYPGDIHPDARFWECQKNIIPCGGTHLSKAGAVGPLKVKRKNIGKGKERIICTLEDPFYTTEQYQDFMER